MRGKIIYFMAIAILFFAGGCKDDDPFNKGVLTGRTISLAITMPDHPPTPRIALTEEAGYRISLTWEETDELELAFVQGDVTRKGIAIVKNISANKKQADLEIVLPDDIAEGEPFDLYGVYGGGGLSHDNPTQAILPTNTSNGSIELIQENKHVMLYFATKGFNPSIPGNSISLEHLGALFSISLKNSDTEPLNDITEVQLVAANNETGWAYNTGGGGGSYDLSTGEFTGEEDDFIFFNAAGSSLQDEETMTFWGWYPPSPEMKWPALNLKVITGSTEYVTTVTRPERKAPTAVGGPFYFFAEWTGSELQFTDETFDPIGPLFLNKPSLVFKKAGGNEVVNITADEGWSASSSAPWLSVTPSNGSGDGAITVSAISNRGVWREAAVTLTNTDKTVTKTVSVTQNGFASDLFFSEYISGTNSNYYIEIYNGTGQPVDLRYYYVRRYGVGSTSPAFSAAPKFAADDPNRFLQHGEVYVLKSGSATLYEGEAEASGGIYYPGNIAVELYNGRTKTTADIIGRIGENPGSDGWVVPGTELTTKNRTLVRKSSVRKGVTENPAEGFPTLSSEWISYPMGTVDHLGSHAMDDMTAGDAFVSTLNPTQQRYITTIEGEIAYHEFFEMTNQIPLINTSDLNIGDTGGISYSDFLVTLDDIDCQKEVIATVRGFDVVGMAIGDVETKPVVLLFNQHGAERAAVHTLRELAKYLTTSQDEQVQYLLDKVAFYIIPTVAGWNYEHRKYLLENGVNLNRIWDNRWEESTDETKGTEGPWSEPEVIVARDKILELKPLLMIDTHSSTSPGLGVYSFTWRPLLMAVHDSVDDLIDNTMYWSSGASPTATGWGQHQFARDGEPMIATSIEVDGGVSNHAASINHGINALIRLSYIATKLRVEY